MPKVSVVIPAYNVQEHIARCVKSVQAQTLRKIEIICVNDASTDRTALILESMAVDDSRIKVISLPVNGSASQARKCGVLASSGEVVMFLDGDDVLRPTACETVYKTIKETDVDMVHFGTRVLNFGGLPPERIKANQKLVMPHMGKIEGDLIDACFGKRKFFFTLWNKAFKGDLARKSFLFVEDGRLPKAQDLYATFVLLYFSRSYLGISEVLIDYNFGAGITGGKSYSLDSFDRVSSAALVPGCIERFLGKVGGDRYEEILISIKKNLLSDGVNQLLNHVRPEDFGAAFDLLCRRWSHIDVISNIAERAAKAPTRFDAIKFAELIKSSEVLHSGRPREPKVIGVFYYRLHGGGVQRAISLLIPILVNLGYKVVLITEESNPDQEYELPRDVEREIVPSYVRKGVPDYASRADALRHVVLKHKIDVVSYHASSGEALLFDLLLLRSLGCYFVLSRHELAFAPLLVAAEKAVNKNSIFSLADCVTCLTRMDEKFYRIMGVPAVYIPNPPAEFPSLAHRVKQTDPVIIWVGRLDYVYKQCQEPIEIMREVVTSVPSAKLLMIGGEWSPNARSDLLARIKSLGLERNVELCGYTPEPQQYFARATCQLITSSCESYGMVIEEGRSYGLPLVLYDLPYLELLRNKKGFISVPQGDRNSAAKALVTLMTDSRLRHELGVQAYEELQVSATTDECVNGWRQILTFDSQLMELNLSDDDRLVKLLLTTLLDLCGRGLASVRHEAKAAKDDLKKLTESCRTERPWLVKKAIELKCTDGVEVPGARLKNLVERRKKFGAIGALDFLIERERK